jgi:predicted transcriptional regulator
MVTPAPSGPALRAWRESLALSRQALAELAGGISTTTIVRIEAGEVSPHPRTIQALVGALRARSAALAAYNENDGAEGTAPSLETSPGMGPRHGTA